MRFVLPVLMMFFASNAFAQSRSDVPPPEDNVGPFSESAKGIPPELVPIQRKHSVVLVYFVPKDRNPVDSYQEAMTLYVRFANSYFADAEKTWNSVSKGEDSAKCGLSFVFDEDHPELLKILLVQGKYPSKYYNGLNIRKKKQFELHMTDHAHRVEREVEKFMEKKPEFQHCLPLVFSETWDFQNGSQERVEPFSLLRVTGKYPYVTTQNLTMYPAGNLPVFLEQMRKNLGVSGFCRTVGHELGHAVLNMRGHLTSDQHAFYYLMSQSKGPQVQNFLPDHRPFGSLPKVRFSPGSCERLKNSPFMEDGDPVELKVVQR